VRFQGTPMKKTLRESSDPPPLVVPVAIQVREPLGSAGTHNTGGSVSGGGSNCLGCQADIGRLRRSAAKTFHLSSCLIMLLRIRSSFRMQAVRATFFGLPAAQSLW